MPKPGTQDEVESARHPAATRRSFRKWRDDDELWSCFGYDALVAAFDLPPSALQDLPEERKRGLMRLLVRLADREDDPLHDHVRSLEISSPDERLAALLDLSTRLQQ